MGNILTVWKTNKNLENIVAKREGKLPEMDGELKSLKKA